MQTMSKGKHSPRQTKTVVRKPATKLPHLRKQMTKLRTQQRPGGK
jgi:hypothetical protein